ncbi:MAG: nucleoside recognition domain-containing protein, partial [Candidatus Adiutrix sp.]|nr:nucleoside recognition domain-containing protein [Candidatus Adiutrix sp.]
RNNFREILPGLRRRLAQRLTTLISVAVPVYYLVTLAAALGFFDMVRDYSSAHLPDFFLPVEAAALIVFSLTAEFSSGFAAAGALIQNSTLTVVQAAAALVVGNIIATPIRVLRWQLAAFLGFFKLRLGLILIVCNQSFRVLSLAAALFIFWQIFA